MRFNTLRYYISSALESMFRNRLMTLVSIIIVTSCISIFIISYSLASNIDYVLEQVGNSLGFTVYFKDDVNDSKVKELQLEIEKFGHVESVNFISKDEALEKMGEWMKDDAQILEGLANDNPLPITLEIYTDTVENRNTVVDEVKRLDINTKFIDKIVANDMSSFISLSSAIRVFSIFIVSAMGIISVIIIMNTIKLTVNNRKREINIMKYVGATDWFIKWPFILEGIFIGLIGATIPVVIGYFSYNLGITFIQREFTLLNVLNTNAVFRTTQEIFIIVIPVALGLGVLLGIIGSANSIRKHLHV